MKLTKKDILAIPYFQAIGFDEIRALTIGTISLDSRTVMPGDLFIAIHGEHYDAHNFISTAVESGAGALIVERRWAESNSAMMVSLNLPRLVVENSFHALGRLANIYRRKFDIPILAVGGSNGKTTTKEMLKSILNCKYTVLCTEGNLNNHIGVPQTLFRLEKKHDVAVLEVGANHPGEIAYLCSIVEPTHGVITNIGCEHLEFFGSLDGVASSEGELFEWIYDHHGIGFVNLDNTHIAKFTKKMKKSITYGFDAKLASVRGSDLHLDNQASARFLAKPKGKKGFSIILSTPGEQNAKNALAAVAIGMTFRVPQVDMQKALLKFSAPNKRMQVIRVGGVTILDDTYNSNPDSVLAGLKTLSVLQTSGKKIAVLADMLELGIHSAELHSQIGRAVSDSTIDVLLTYGTLSQSTYETANVNTKSHFEQKASLAEYLLQTVTSGDVVLVKGSRGMKMEEIVTVLNERFSSSIG